MTQYREILRLTTLGLNKTKIAQSIGCSRNTVRTVLERMKEKGLTWPLPDEMTDEKLQDLLFGKRGAKPRRKQPDLDYIHREMLKDGVNLKLLWSEYCGECRQNGEQPLMYSHFCEVYRQHRQTKQKTMHIPRKPGELLEVDWAGKTASLIDQDTGERIKVYFFVATLPYSQYAYVQGFLTMTTESWIEAHVNMYRYFGGATKILVPDNLKTGIVKPDLYDPQINRTYQELSEHYHTAIIPARIRKPKDKPSVESTVGTITTWIIATIRNEQFFSLSEMNQVIHEKLETFNTRPFQKREGSRQSIFLSEEKALLMPLPSTPYELSTWRQATVQYNYHIQVEKMYYSVPYSYIRNKVDVRITKQIVEVFYKNKRIASHKRLRGAPGQYSTLKEHMPKSHQQYLNWDKDKIMEQAKLIGTNTFIVVQSILSSYKLEQQAKKYCMGLLRLTKKHSEERLENACLKALSYTPNPSLKTVKDILAAELDKKENTATQQKKQVQENQSYGYTRGASYYGGDYNDD